MALFRNFNVLSPWWVGLIGISAVLITLALTGINLFAAICAAILCAALSKWTRNKFKLRHEHRAAMWIHKATPAAHRAHNAVPGMIGHLSFGIVAVIFGAILFAWLMGPFGALVPALVLTVKSRISNLQTNQRRSGVRSVSTSGRAGRKNAPGHVVVAG